MIIVFATERMKHAPSLVLIRVILDYANPLVSCNTGRSYRGLCPCFVQFWFSWRWWLIKYFYGERESQERLCQQQESPVLWHLLRGEPGAKFLWKFWWHNTRAFCKYTSGNYRPIFSNPTCKVAYPILLLAV